MLSDEERKAIENLKIEYEKLIKEDNILFPLYKSDAKRLINLIEKQSKEIEELQINNKKLQDKCKELIFEKQELTSALLDSTPNDKIKAKIEEDNKKYKAIESNYTEQAIDDGDFELNDYVELQSIQYADDILQSLLEKE